MACVASRSVKSLLSASAVLILWGVSAGAAWGQDKSKQTSGKWSVKPDPPVRKVEWPDDLKLSIEQPRRNDEILFPTTESEFALVGLDHDDSEDGELWNLSTGKKVGKISGKPLRAHKRALSPDGKYLAVQSIDAATKNHVEVWSLETGQRTAVFPCDDGGLHVTILDFAGPGEVLTYTFGQLAGKFVFHLRVWDAATGKSLRQIDLDKNLTASKNMHDISPGRRWMAAVAIPDVLIFDLQTGQIQGKLKPTEKTESGEFVSIEAVRFSPDGTSLALYCHGQHDDLLEEFDMATGESKRKLDIAKAYKNSVKHSASYKGPPIEFVSVPKGYLLYGSGFLEQETGLMVWSYNEGVLDFSHWKRLLTPGGFIVSVGRSDDRKLKSLPFPAKAIEASLAVYRGDGPAIIKPGSKVKVVVKVGQVRFGKPDEAKKSIEDVLADRLATDGLEVEDDGTTILTVDYKESAGKTLQEVQGGSPLRGGTPTGRSVQSTQGDVSIKWTTKDGKTTIYKDTFALDPSYLSVRGVEKVTDEVARQKVFDMLKLKLAGLPLPYFVPEDKSLSALPVQTSGEVAGGKKLSPEEERKKKIDARKNLGKKPTK